MATAPVPPQPADSVSEQQASKKVASVDPQSTVAAVPAPPTTNGIDPASADAAVHDEPKAGAESAPTTADTGQVPAAETSTSTPPGPEGSDNPPASTSDAEKDKDKGSTATTLQPKGSSRRKGNKSSQSEAALTASSADKSGSATVTSHTPPATKKKDSKSVKPAKPSFFARVFRRIVPCVGPSAAHDIEPDLRTDGSLKEKEKEKEKAPEGAKDKDKDVPAKEEDAPAKDKEAAAPEAGAAGAEGAPAPLTIPARTGSDSEVILPPTPTKLLPLPETEGMTSGAVQPPGSTGEEPLDHSRIQTHDSGDESEGTSFNTDDEVEDTPAVDDAEDEEDRLILNGGAGIPIGPDGVPRPQLPPIAPQHVGRKCLVLDLDETLVHSSFKSIQQADYVVPVEIEYHWHNVYVIKRPGVDNFLKKMGEIYEVVVFTASLSKYADPVLDKLDIHQVVSHRLFRESCYNHRGNYVKDLSQLGRPIADTIILDNSPASYLFHPNNAVPVSSWFNDPHDTELTDLCPFLADLASVDDVRGVLDGGL